MPPRLERYLLPQTTSGKLPDNKSDNYGSLRRLEAFVRNGGGLMLFTGDHVDTEFYNTRFYNKGAGLCPVTISARKGDPSRRGQYVRWELKSIRPTGLLGFFAGDMLGVSNGIRFFGYTPASDPAGKVGDLPAAVVEARYDDSAQSPAR